METQGSELHQSALLTEYEVAHNHAWKFDNSIWQTAAVFIPTSLAGFVFTAQNQGFSPSRFFSVAAIGIGSILMLVGWIGLVNRWDAYKRVVFARIREIEEELGLWHNRYLEHMHITRIMNRKDTSAQTEPDKARLQKLDQAFPSFPHISTSSLLKVTAIVIIIAWIVVIVVEFIFTFLF